MDAFMMVLMRVMFGCIVGAFVLAVPHFVEDWLPGHLPEWYISLTLVAWYATYGTGILFCVLLAVSMVWYGDFFWGKYAGLVP